MQNESWFRVSTGDAQAAEPCHGTAEEGCSILLKVPVESMLVKGGEI